MSEHRQEWTAGDIQITVYRHEDGNRGLVMGTETADLSPAAAGEIAAALGPEENDETVVCPECRQTVDVIGGRLIEHRWTDTDDGNEGRCAGSGISAKIDAATHDERIDVLEDQLGILTRKVKEIDDRPTLPSLAAALGPEETDKDGDITVECPECGRHLDVSGGKLPIHLPTHRATGVYVGDEMCAGSGNPPDKPTRGPLAPEWVVGVEAGLWLSGEGAGVTTRRERARTYDSLKGASIALTLARRLRPFKDAEILDAATGLRP